MLFSLRLQMERKWKSETILRILYTKKTFEIVSLHPDAMQYLVGISIAIVSTNVKAFREFSLLYVIQKTVW